MVFTLFDIMMQKFMTKNDLLDSFFLMIPTPLLLSFLPLLLLLPPSLLPFLFFLWLVVSPLSEAGVESSA
jgi:hypothetical protein